MGEKPMKTLLRFKNVILVGSTPLWSTCGRKKAIAAPPIGFNSQTFDVPPGGRKR